MQSFLEKLADVRMGLTLRGADASRRTSEEGPLYIRISDLTEDGDILIGDSHRIDPNQVPGDKHHVLTGDIVLANRGARMTAAMVPEGLHAVASGQLFIIRPKSRKVLPAYLKAFLNLQATQNHLRSHARGTYVQTLSISILRSLEVPLPPMEIQEKIASLSELAVTERRLVRELSTKRTDYIESSLNRFLIHSSKQTS